MSAHDHPVRSFAGALDTAIAAHGLTLDRLRRHLADHGVAVSNATLSYWRRGLRQPENERSRRAVAVLEQVLDLPPATLTSRIGPPRPRGRWVDRAEQMPIGDLIAQLATPGEGRRSLVSVHDVYTVTEHGTERGVRTRIVLRGLGGRVTRYVVGYQSDHPGIVPVLADVDYASVGRVLTDPGAGYLVAELVLDRPIRGGEYAVLEYEIGGHATPPIAHYFRNLRRPVSEYTQLIRFEGRPPAFCTSYWQANASAPVHAVKSVRMGKSRDVCFVVRDGRVGIIGTDWRW
ncbi:hypothetical protein [Actinokineospora fastidiosa]|uniref:Uncharacterized protein n=1 Tax=Actinokineospora fastidiosa TaxID=1816 RepID=A0A918GL18_9PSEU|nr:hypothetical protein [Actinokineospora fastidiosa]GGS45411.1 hypothetical protein GCM10010171_45620 [Actinokineospora fastidiosa]